MLMVMMVLMRMRMVMSSELSDFLQYFFSDVKADLSPLTCFLVKLQREEHVLQGLRQASPAPHTWAWRR